MSESLPKSDHELQAEFRNRRIEICKRLFAAYAVVEEARNNPWVRDYCEAQLLVPDGDVFPEAVSQMWNDTRFEYSVRGLFDIRPGAVLTDQEQQTVLFVESALTFTRARDVACQPMAAALLQAE